MGLRLVLVLLLPLVLKLVVLKTVSTRTSKKALADCPRLHGPKHVASLCMRLQGRVRDVTLLLPLPLNLLPACCHRLLLQSLQTLPALRQQMLLLLLLLWARRSTLLVQILVLV